jgi:hypothetical protein
MEMFTLWKNTMNSKDDLSEPVNLVLLGIL